MQILEDDRPRSRTKTSFQISRHTERQLAPARVGRQLRLRSVRVGERECRELAGDHSRFLFVEAAHSSDARLDLRARVVTTIRGRDSRLCADELLQRPIRDRVSVWEARGASDRLDWIEAPQEFKRDTCLADPGVTINGHEVRASRGGDAAVYIVKEAHLRVASDERRRCVPCGSARPCEALGCRDLDGPHTFGLDRSDGTVLHPATSDLARHGTDQYFAVVCLFFEASRDDDWAAGYEELGALAISRHNLSGVDADPQREARSAVLAVRGDVGAQRKRGPNSALGVVLVRDRNSEDSHYRIADELFDGRAVSHEDLARPGEHARECRAEHLSVIRTGRTARIDDVREQDRDDLPFLRHEASLGAAR